MGYSKTQLASLKRWYEDYDFPNYAETNLKIIDKNAQLVPFKLNKAQMRVWEEVKDDLINGRPCRYYLLKARQMGFSTFIQGLQYWITTGRMYFRGLTVSHNEPSVKAMFNKPKVFFGKSPRWLRPSRQLSNRAELFFAKDDETGEDIGLQSGLQVTSVKDEHLAASMTLNFVHLSEFARYESIRADVIDPLVSVIQTVPRTVETFVFMETTAYGLGFAKDFWDDEENGYKKVFVSWIADPSYTLDEPLDEEVLEGLPDGPYQDEFLVRDQILSELEFWWPEKCTTEGWRETEALKRLAWRRMMIKSQLFGDVKRFNQEYPLTAEEAFITSGRNVFDTAKLADIRRALVNDRPPVKMLRWHRQDRKWIQAAYGDAKKFKEPNPSSRYIIGADVAEGLRDGDNSAFTVISLPDFEEVFTYAGTISPDDFADMLSAVGREYNLAYICCEVNGPGIATNLRLAQRLYYPLLYTRETFDSSTRSYQKRYGWNTNKASKNVAISDLRASIDNDIVRFNDIDSIDELMYYVYNETKMEAAPGHKDDRVMAWALAVQMMHNQNLISWRPPEDKQPTWREAPEDSIFGLFKEFAVEGEDWSADREA